MRQVFCHKKKKLDFSCNLCRQTSHMKCQTLSKAQVRLIKVFVVYQCVIAGICKQMVLVLIRQHRYHRINLSGYRIHFAIYMYINFKLTH